MVFTRIHKTATITNFQCLCPIFFSRTSHLESISAARGHLELSRFHECGCVAPHREIPWHIDASKLLQCSVQSCKHFISGGFLKVHLIIYKTMSEEWLLSFLFCFTVPESVGPRLTEIEMFDFQSCLTRCQSEGMFGLSWRKSPRIQCPLLTNQVCAGGWHVLLVSVSCAWSYRKPAS